MRAFRLFGKVKKARAASESPRFSEPSDFERAQYPILAAPWKGSTVYVMVRELTQAQILSCGNFSLVETFQDKINKERMRNPTTAQLVEYAEIHHAIARAALLHPTYEEILKIYEVDPWILGAREELAAIKAKIMDTPRGPERAELEERVDALLIRTDLILPEDFLAFVVGYSIGIEKSGIKLVSEEMLADAAVLAERGHDNPADHLRGAWDGLPSAQFYRDDINARAWILLSEMRKREKQGA